MSFQELINKSHSCEVFRTQTICHTRNGVMRESISLAVCSVCVYMYTRMCARIDPEIYRVHGPGAHVKAGTISICVSSFKGKY